MDTAISFDLFLCVPTLTVTPLPSLSLSSSTALRGGGYDPFGKAKDGPGAEKGGGKGGMSEAERRIADIGNRAHACTYVHANAHTTKAHIFHTLGSRISLYAHSEHAKESTERHRDRVHGRISCTKHKVVVSRESVQVHLYVIFL